MAEQQLGRHVLAGMWQGISAVGGGATGRRDRGQAACSPTVHPPVPLPLFAPLLSHHSGGGGGRRDN